MPPLLSTPLPRSRDRGYEPDSVSSSPRRKKKKKHPPRRNSSTNPFRISPRPPKTTPGPLTQEKEAQRENGTKARGFKLVPVRLEAAAAAAAEPEGDSGTPTNKKKKKKKGANERDLNPYRSLTRVLCDGTMDDGVTPCDKKVT